MFWIFFMLSEINICKTPESNRLESGAKLELINSH
jgi:hypothetical protein